MPLQWTATTNQVGSWQPFSLDGFIPLQGVKVVALSRLFADAERTVVVIQPPPTSA
jgi:hypothetical protein